MSEERFLGLSEVALERLDALLDDAVAAHAEAAVRLCEFLEKDDEDGVRRIGGLLYDVREAKRRVDDIVDLRAEEGCWV